MKSKGSNFHPARISNRAKLELSMFVNGSNSSKKTKIKPIDTKKADWSVKK